MNRFIFLTLVVVLAASADQSCHGQNWRDPAFEQPLPQYYPPNRYPLDDPVVDLPPTDSPVQLSNPQSPASPTTKTIAPEPKQPNAVKSLSATPKDAESVAPKKSNPNPLTQKPAAKRLPANKSATSKAAKEKNTKTAKPSPPVITYDLYRDRSRFPIDPRKPCSVCRRPLGTCNCGVEHGQCGPGNHGQPFQEKEPGGYACGKNCPDKRPMFSVYWPRPFSARRAERHPHPCGCDQCRTRINDRFDHLIDFKLIDYQRTDNGYEGHGADPFGCLGESKYQGLGIH